MTPTTKHIVLFDSDCPLCTFQMKVITWLDWLDVASLLPISHPRAKSIAPSVDRAQLREAIHCVSPEGDTQRGARAIRFLSMRLPLAIPLALVLWLPGVIWVAERIYAWVSRNRLLLSRVFGCKSACAVLPERKRDDDELPRREE